MQTRRDFLRTAGLGALALTFGSCASNDYTSKDDFSQFTHYLGREWYRLPEEKKQETREAWKEADEDTKKMLNDVYKNPREAYNSLNEEGREKVDSIFYEVENNHNLKCLGGYKELKEITDQLPWIDISNLTKKDIILLRKIGEAFAAAVMISH